MEVIKVIKTFTSGKITKYLVLYADVCSEEFAKECAKDWCEEDGNGANNGYSFEWEFVKDKEEIKDALSKEITSITNKIGIMENKREKIFNYYRIISNEG